MTAVSYALGRPRPAASRGGDVCASDLAQDRNVDHTHRFASTSDCHISNGMIRLTLGASGVAPALTVEAWRGPVTVDDVYDDVYDDLYGGSLSAKAWMVMGTITIDSPSVSAILTGVRLEAISDEALVLRLVVPAIGDAFVLLRRGEPMIRVQHGATRPSTVAAERRIGWTASPSPVGTAAVGRIQEDTPSVVGLYRFVAGVDAVTVDAGGFSVATASVTTARFGAGVGNDILAAGPASLHGQLGDSSMWPEIVLGTD